MAILINLNKNFYNTYEVVFDCNILTNSIEKINESGTLYVYNFDSQTKKVGYVSIVSEKELTNKQWSIVNQNLFEKILVNCPTSLVIEDKANIKIGKIVARNTHPKSDKLFILDVDFGAEINKIVTNTLYTTTEKYLAWYQSGSITPQGMEIKTNEVMGISSDGMLCSAKSLGLNDKENLFENDVINNIPIESKNEYIGKNIEVVYKELLC
ncbi:phenylalanyl-tRNA synthetase subunit beta [Mycoplasmopsis bovigenitalium]|uniref:Phenylalanyl-tRNA synthetase subunit beta n=1 Tax=Mycoplasmopsis bovigenitalium TaxID=2112 RepID=A0A449A857_9BACT|nr:hypothetical protein [Mycoplasmopsis bovigenitalium]VEU60445.1 phenylalanyl-tRNA synthetase subunit beta [Mycoplasmopsis bovigenitalium]